MDTSKQNIHQMLSRKMRTMEQMSYISMLIQEIRADHPTLSCRAMYHKLQPENMGRDAFEQMCSELGFTAERKINRHRTTDSTGVIRFDNLLANEVLTDINQAWLSNL